MRHEAIYKLYPNVVTIDDGEGSYDAQGNKIEIDEALVQQEIQRLEPIRNNEIIEIKRKNAYISEADPLFFKTQRGEATLEEWQLKILEIKTRYPKT
jgi:hypothetical protein